jgi:hypothetical protein
MSSIIDNLKAGLKESSQAGSDLDTQTKTNLFKSVSKLSEGFLNDVNTGKIEVRDIKDMKDVASIYNMIVQAGGIDGGESAPELSKGIRNYWIVNNNQPVDDVEGDDVVDQLKGMSKEDINKMLDAQEKIKNNENAGDV